jgi:signal transduction histidine kinase
MSDAAALTLQPEIVSKRINKVNLLIVGDLRLNLPQILKPIERSGIDFAYKLISEFSDDRKELSKLAQHYDAIVYDYYPCQNSLHIESPLTQLDWWYRSKPRVPLILITDALGDELAVECIQSGINAYLLRSKLSKLPETLRNCLLDVAQKQENSQFKVFQQETLQHSDREEKPESEPVTSSLDKEEYIADLTHELRAPLTGILGFSRVLIEEIFGSLNPKQMQYLKAIAESGEHLLELVNDFLDISKIDADKEVVYPEKITVEDVCRASMSILQEKAREKNIGFNLIVDEKIDFCLADRRRLKQILVNLLSNAIKFTEVGSVILKVTPQQEKIVFSVIDTGIGIAESDRDKLFQPFQQIKSHLHTRYNGTGLGLALSRKLAKLQGGDLTFTSESGKGSCFNLYLPVNRD